MAQVLLLQGCGNIFEVFTDIQNEIKSTESEIHSTERMSDKGEPSGGTLNLYLKKIDTANPLFADDFYLRDIYSLIFESLFMLDEKAKATPVIARSCSASEDCLEWTITLRSDVYWHDGTKLTANDVAFTLDQILGSNEENIFKDDLSVIKSFLATEPYIIKIALTKPFAFLPELLTFPVIPRHVYGNMLSQESSDILPVGTGSYECSEMDMQRGMVLKRNMEWWRSKDPDDPKQAPGIEFISARIYEIPAMEALNEGKVDIAYIDKYHLSEYAENKDTILYQYVGRYFEFISFNTKNKILEDKSVREAIASSIDRDGIVLKLTGNKSVVWGIPVLYDTWLLPENLGIYHNAAGNGAKELLENAGWDLKKDLWTKRINGKNEAIKLELLVNNENKLRLDIASEIKEDLKAEGMDITVKALGIDELMERVNDGRYDLALLGCAIPETSIASGLYINDQKSLRTPYALRNISQINNDLMSESFRMLYLTANTEERINIASEIAERMYNEMAYTGICLNKEAVVFSRRVRNTVASYIWNRLNGINEWYVIE